MKKTIFISLIFLSIIGCSQKDAVNFDKNCTLIIEERIGDDDSRNYEVINEIADKQLVQEVIHIFQRANWEINVDVDMPREPDFKINDLYHIWTAPKGNNLVIVFTENSYYVQLSESKSSKLFAIMTEKRTSK